MARANSSVVWKRYMHVDPNNDFVVQSEVDGRTPTAAAIKAAGYANKSNPLRRRVDSVVLISADRSKLFRYNVTYEATANSANDRICVKRDKYINLADRREYLMQQNQALKI